MKTTCHDNPVEKSVVIERSAQEKLTLCCNREQGQLRNLAIVTSVPQEEDLPRIAQEIILNKPEMQLLKTLLNSIPDEELV